MITRLQKLNKLQQAKLLTQAEETLESWEETGNPEIIWDGRSHIALLNNEDETILALHRCKCGELIATHEDYEGSLGECPKCGAGYEE